MAKKSKESRVQVILECTEHKESGMPALLATLLQRTEKTLQTDWNLRSTTQS